MAGTSRYSRGFRAGAALMCIALLGGCGTSVRLVDTKLPDALVEPYPLTAALRFGENIETFVYEEELPSGGTYSIDLGGASAMMFTATADDMFARLVPVEPGSAPPGGIDLLIEPSLVALEFALPQQTVTEDYAVWIRYQIKVYDAQGRLQAEFPISAYGKAPRDALMGGTKDALRSAASLAIRDAAVIMLTAFEREAGLAKRQLAGLAAAQPIPPAAGDPPPKPDEPADESTPPSDNAEKFL